MWRCAPGAASNGGAIGSPWRCTPGTSLRSSVSVPEREPRRFSECTGRLCCPTWDNSQIWGKLDCHGANRARNRPKSAITRQFLGYDFADRGQIWLEIDQVWPDFDKIWPNIGQVRPKLDPNRPYFGQSRLSGGRRPPELTRIRATMGRHRPLSARPPP